MMENWGFSFSLLLKNLGPTVMPLSIHQRWGINLLVGVFLVSFVLFSDTGEPILGSAKVKSNADEPSPLFLAEVARGCSMSSSARKFGIELLRLHGYNKINEYEREGFDCEILTKSKNVWYEETQDMNQALQLMANEAAEVNTTVVVKYVPWNLDKVKTGIRSIKQNVVFLHRRNLLDYYICRVRDCMEMDSKVLGDESNHSYAIDALTGKETDLCFGRRHSENATVQAFIEVDNLAEMFQVMIKQYTHDLQTVSRVFKDMTFEIVATEDLWAFEYDKTTESLELSLQSWVRVLDSWGVTPDVPRLRKYLKTHWRRNVKRLKPTATNVYNAEEVKKALETRPELKDYRRYWRD